MYGHSLRHACSKAGRVLIAEKDKRGLGQQQKTSREERQREKKRFRGPRFLPHIFIPPLRLLFAARWAHRRDCDTRNLGAPPRPAGALEHSLRRHAAHRRTAAEIAEEDCWHSTGAAARCAAAAGRLGSARWRRGVVRGLGASYATAWKRRRRPATPPRPAPPRIGHRYLNVILAGPRCWLESLHSVANT